MAIKYTRPEPAERRQREPTQRVRLLRYSAAPPSRKALTWIIAGTALVVVLLMLTSQLTSMQPAHEDPWVNGTVVPNDAEDPANVLRVEVLNESDEPPHVYDISVADHPALKTLSPGSVVRIQYKANDAGGIERILQVEPAEATATSE